MTMRPCDQAVLDHMEEFGNPLGWTPSGRDADGHAIMRTTHTKADGTLRISYMKITPQGLYYDTVEHGDTPKASE